MSEVNDEVLERLLAQIVKDSPMQATMLASTLGQLAAQERADLADYVRLCAANGVSMAGLSKAYGVISADTLREQVYFRRHGHYRYSTFDQVAGKVYFDPGYMANYMHGLALTQFLWPNHLAIYRFFRSSIERAAGGRYLEIGPGHGAYFRMALRSGRFDSCLGVDISPTSLEQTRALLESEAPGRTPWRLVESDFLAMSPQESAFDAIVMGEVLEHVESPALFLAKTHDLASAGAFIFITTAVNAPAIDHIYLFTNVQEVETMARDAGFGIVDVLATPYHGCTMQETVERRLPVNVAMVLTK